MPNAENGEWRMANGECRMPNAKNGERLNDDVAKDAMKRAAGSGQPEARSRQPEARSRELAAGSRELAAGSRQLAARRARSWRATVAGAAMIALVAATLATHADGARVADAAMTGDAALVRTLLKGGEDVNAAQGDGMTALHWAARR